jgi:hypothetical protein
MKKFLPVLFSIIIVVIAFSVTNLNKASATELNDNINQQVNDLDLSELQEFFNGIENNGDINFYGFLAVIWLLIAAEWRFTLAKKRR